MPFPLCLNDQIYQQGNISSVCSNINISSMNPDVRRSCRSHGVRRNGLLRRQQRLDRSSDDFWRIANNNGRHELLHLPSSIQYLDWNQSWIMQIAEVYDIQIDLNSKRLWLFSFNKLFPRLQPLPPKTQFIKIIRRRSDSVLWQKPLYQQKIRKSIDNTKTKPKSLITQRLRTDLGRSIGVTPVIHVW